MSLRRLLGQFAPSIGTDNESNRDAWIKQTLASIPPGHRILDAGAGPQTHRKYCDHLRYVSQDFAQYDGKGDEAGLQVAGFDYGTLDIVSDITEIPEPDASFDAILCSEVLEHVPDPVSALKEFSRLLRNGGRLILTAPFSSLTHFSPYHFSTGFNRYWYEKHLTDLGFVVSEIQPNGSFFSYLAQEIARTPSVSSSYAKASLSLVDRLAVQLTRRMLARLAKADTGSWELLCYGYNVTATKR